MDAHTKRALRARRAALKHRMAAARARASAQLREHRAPRDRWRTRRRLLLLCLLLLLLLLRCEAEPIIVPVVSTPAVAQLQDAGLARPARVTPRKVRRRSKATARIPTRVRPDYRGEAPAPQAWLPAFRLQVAARSPRLSRCFVGSERPGAVKWTAAIDVARGVVSDHELKPVLAGAALSKALRACLIGVLSKPDYGRAVADDASPSRVSIVIEF